MAKVNKEKFDWDVFVSNANIDGSEKIVVHCQTENESKEFRKLMHEHGLRWRGGDSYLNHSNWSEYRERTYYAGNGRYGTIDSANKKGYTVLKFKLLDFD